MLASTKPGSAMAIPSTSSLCGAYRAYICLLYTSQKTLEALQAAQQLAVEYQHNQLEPEHLLHALASQEQGLIPQLLQKLNVDPGSFAAAVAEKLSALPRVSGSGRDPDKVYISQAADKVLSAAAREAKAMKDDYCLLYTSRCV